MAGQTSNFAASVRDKYEKVKFSLVYMILVVTIIGSFAAPTLTLGQKLLVFGVGGAFGIILNILRSIEGRFVMQETSVEFASLSDAIPKIREIVNKGGQHKIEVIASDGGYVGNDLLPKLRDDQKTLHREIEIQIRLVNPGSTISSLMPVHWRTNVEGNLAKILACSDAGLKIIPIRYDYLPCVAGVLIDNKHLFLGFYAWVSSKDLEGAGRPHTYYQRSDPKYEKYFTLFESWSNVAPAL